MAKNDPMVIAEQRAKLVVQAVQISNNFALHQSDTLDVTKRIQEVVIPYLRSLEPPDLVALEMATVLKLLLQNQVAIMAGLDCLMAEMVVRQSETSVIQIQH